jgi:ATP-dependent helicase HrpB
LALLREVQTSVRPDLVLIVMSATLDAGPVAEFLGGCHVVRSEGRSFSVVIEYEEADRGRFPERVARAVAREAARPDSGDVLVFLPGAEEIRRVARLLEGVEVLRDSTVLPLHGSLSADEQDRTLRPADRRKVVLATNVAETSLTIPGVRTVIDGGLARVVHHDPTRGLDRLVLARISRASANQRAGRAGRLGPGRCVRLWSPRAERGMPGSETPEVARADLAGLLLSVLAWGSTPESFGWFQAPPDAAVQDTLTLLGRLGAIADGRITPLGQRLIHLPVHPRLGRMLLAAVEWGVAREGATLAALLEERDLFDRGDLMAQRDRPRGPSSVQSSDWLVRLDLLERSRTDAEARAAGLDPRLVGRVRRARDQLLKSMDRNVKSPRPSAPVVEEHLLKLPVLAYPDRVVRRRAPGSSKGLMVGGRGVRLGPESVVREAEFFVALDPREDDRGAVLEAHVRVASEIRPEWLEEMFPFLVSRRREVTFDESRGRATGRDLWLYEDLVLREAQANVDRDEAERVLAAFLGNRAESFVREQEAAAVWLERMACLRDWLPEAGLPSFDADALAEVVAHACMGKTIADEVRRSAWVPMLEGQLTHDQSRLLKTEAPGSLVVPSGNRLRLTYERGRPPVLAVRLQELFGWADSPTVARGRVRVLLHLLGPNFRPVQITDDLRSFWTTTYFQVRKDLRARYPRHSWPEDPTTARAEAKGGRRGEAK